MKCALHLITGSALSLLLVAACAVDGNPGGGAQADAGPGADAGGGSTGDDSCDSARDCPGDQVCDPDTDRCADLPCTTHGECGTGGYCTDGGTCADNSTGGPCDESVNCSAGETCVGGFCGCEGLSVAAEPVAPNMLVVLDRSDSMNDEVGGESKWDIAGEAMSLILTTYGDRVRFGLSMYASVTNPGGNACNPGDLDVDVGDGTATAVQMAISNTDAATNTPIGSTLQARVGYSGLADTAHPNYILLLTDGAETCDGDGVDAVQTLRAQTPEVKTFVVGFGGEVDEDSLNAMATEGGTALPGDPAYYQADDAAALNQAFESIIGTALACSYQLSEEPSSPDGIYVYFDGTAVERDTTGAGGWDYDEASNQVRFSGASCESLESGSVTDLVIVFGCPGGVD